MSPSEPLSTPANPQHPAASGGSSLDEALERELAEWNEAGLRRRLEEPIPAAAACDFVSNDYLGFSQHPDVIEAARAALTDFGAGGRAARLLGGGCPLHERAESRAAEWLGAAAGLLFPSGYQANVGLLTALAGAGDAIISDEACHASLIDACRLSRARTLVHGHLDLEHAGQQLAAASGARRRLLITEGVFSRNTEEVELYRVRDYKLTQPFWLRLFGLGNIVVSTTDNSNPTVVLQAIRDAAGHREEIRKYVEICRDKKRVRITEFES